MKLLKLKKIINKSFKKLVNYLIYLINILTSNKIQNLIIIKIELINNLLIF